MSRVDELLSVISGKNIFQAKYLAGSVQKMSKQEKTDLRYYLDYMTTYSVGEIADAYLLFIEDTMKETKYFVENGSKHYRYSTYDEVADSVYNNDDYMSKYMMGLQLSGYLWIHHLKINRFFLEFLDKYSGKKYLEVGPGHGRYFAEAIDVGRYDEYTAVDLSETSLRMTREYVEDFVKDKTKSIEIEYKLADFLKLGGCDTYDTIVMSEVLEHVEQPKLFLEKAYDVLNDKGMLYLNVPINAPEVDHITLFSHADEARELVLDCGFQIVEEFIATANDVDYEKAVKKKRPLNVVHILRKDK